ncbi:MAG: hypothetical protein CBE00_06490 [Planctomycetaceae bacterium TMED240]|nr:MAG: hypothetical protein CBE00_06490 [Planctomycetaceae bacterium TMED240]
MLAENRHWDRQATVSSQLRGWRHLPENSHTLSLRAEDHCAKHGSNECAQPSPSCCKDSDSENFELLNMQGGRNGPREMRILASYRDIVRRVLPFNL